MSDTCWPVRSVITSSEHIRCVRAGETGLWKESVVHLVRLRSVVYVISSCVVRGDRSAAGYVRGYVVRAQHAGMTQAPVLRRICRRRSPTTSMAQGREGQRRRGAPRRVDRSSPADV